MEVPMSPSNPIADALPLFAQSLNTVPDPRSKQGVSHPCNTILAVVLLGLLAKVSTPAEIARWAKRHFKTLSKFLQFGAIKGKTRTPCDNTLTRVLKKLSLVDLQNAFAVRGRLSLVKLAILLAVLILIKFLRRSSNPLF